MRSRWLGPIRKHDPRPRGIVASIIGDESQPGADHGYGGVGSYIVSGRSEQMNAPSVAWRSVQGKALTSCDDSASMLSESVSTSWAGGSIVTRPSVSAS